MPRAKHSMTAKDFHVPLVQALGAACGGQANVAVPAESLYAPIFTMVGITRDQFGEAEPNVLWTERWVQWAFKKMCTDGYGVGMGRGKWALTPAGAAQLALSGGTTAPPSPTKAATPPQVQAVASAPLQAPVFLLPTRAANDDGNYHADPYIRHLALSDHACMGFFSSASPICATCPARNVCVNARWAKFAALAVQLTEEDRLAVNVAAQKLAATTAVTPTPKAPPVPAAAPVLTAIIIPQGFRVLETVNQVVTVCDHCRGNIAVGDNAIWAKVPTGSAAPAGHKASAMYHKSCVATKV